MSNIRNIINALQESRTDYFRMVIDSYCSDNNGTDDPNHTNESPSSPTLKTLAEPVPAWYELYKRLKLFPYSKRDSEVI
jgi:hypothetical protein